MPELFTQGTWTCDNEGHITNGEKWIASIAGNSGEAMANARLITAAPEMYNALNAFTFFSKCGHCGIFNRSVGYNISHIRELLEKINNSNNN